MKKILILLAILTALAAIAYILKPAEGDDLSSLTGTDREFNYPSDEIGKFVISRPGKETLTFERKSGGEWIINGQYKASQFVIPTLLAPLSRMKIQFIPSKMETQTILADMDRVGIQVKVFDLAGTEVRSYRVGLAALDDSGTAYLMDGSSQPYYMYLKGLAGDIRVRFAQSVSSLRDRGLFEYKPEDIKEIAVKFHKDQKSSFKLVMQGDEATVTPLSDYIPSINRPVNNNYVKAYLGAFNRIYAENFDNENSRRDSLEALIPFVSVVVTDKNGGTNAADFFPLKDIITRNVNTRTMQDATNIERYFVLHKKDGMDDFMLAQHRNVKGILRPYDFFFQK